MNLSVIFRHGQEWKNAEGQEKTISLIFCGIAKNSLLEVQNTTTRYFKIKSRTTLI